MIIPLLLRPVKSQQQTSAKSGFRVDGLRPHNGPAHLCSRWYLRPPLRPPARSHARRPRATGQPTPTRRKCCESRGGSVPILLVKLNRQWIRIYELATTPDLQILTRCLDNFSRKPELEANGRTPLVGPRVSQKSSPVPRRGALLKQILAT